jgi:hypothetical protein
MSENTSALMLPPPPQAPRGTKRPNGTLSGLSTSQKRNFAFMPIEVVVKKPEDIPKLPEKPSKLRKISEEPKPHHALGMCDLYSRINGVVYRFLLENGEMVAFGFPYGDILPMVGTEIVLTE